MIYQDRHYSLLRHNRRNRTITIRCSYRDGSHQDYRSNSLSLADWAYYVHYATESDLIDFLKSNDYYLI